MRASSPAVELEVVAALVVPVELVEPGAQGAREVLVV
jgi:hypothetical protein